MVRSVYLFAGEEPLSKDIRLKRLIQEHLAPELEKFNLNILYARELKLDDLQERLLSLPVKAKKRIIVIKGAEALKSEVKEFILEFARKPAARVILVVDVNRMDADDKFTKALARYAEVSRFKEKFIADTFGLGRAIESRRPDEALRVLNNLLENGKKPEWILGGLRYVFQKGTLSALKKKNRLKLLLACDVDIKTGKMPPVFAMERLVVKLSCLGKP